MVIKSLEYYDDFKPIKIIPTFTKNFLIKNTKLKYFFSFIISFLFKSKIKDFDIFQSNQVWGFWILLICKFLYKKKIIIRQGFDFYDFAIKSKKNILTLLFLKFTLYFCYKYADALI